ETAAFGEPQGMTQPVFVVTLWVIAKCVRTTAFSAIGGRLGGCLGHFDHVGDFKCLDTSRIENLGRILEVDVGYWLGDTLDGVDTLCQEIKRAEYAAMVLHGNTHGIRDILCFFT